MKKLSYKTTLDKFGRVLIPKKIRVNLGLTPGCAKSDYISVIEKLSRQQISGGTTYDALIAQSAIKAGADQLITLNIEDFKKVAPEKLLHAASS